jgi:integrase
MNALTTTQNSQLTPSSAAAIDSAITMWASSTTREGDRLDDLLRDKSRLVRAFFAFVQKQPQEVTPQDIARWLDELREHGIATTDADGELVDGEPFSAASVYAAASRVSSFYKWLAKDERLGGISNPVHLARPKAPRAYENSQALSDEEMDALLEVVWAKASAGELVAMRDYAMIQFYLNTAHRREEVNRLKWKDIKRNGTLQVEFKVKGGEREWEEVDLFVWDALVDYLRAAGRLDGMTQDSPLWTAHDRSGKSTGSPLSSHSFSKNLKAYGRAAGLDAIHVHQLRHTAARVAGEESGGNVGVVQHILGHANQQTTKIYYKRISVKKNPLSAAMARRFNLNGEKS